MAFIMEGRRAMALGRMDQDLYPFYKNDIEMSAREKLGRAKDVSNETYNKEYDEIEALMEKEMSALVSKEVQ